MGGRDGKTEDSNSAVFKLTCEQLDDIPIQFKTQSLLAPVPELQLVYASHNQRKWNVFRNLVYETSKHIIWN